MVGLEVARTANKALISTHPLVAVFVGGTSGLGEYALRALASHASSNDNGKSLRAYIVGRNTAAADTILNDCRKACPHGQFKFIRAENLALLGAVDQCCEQIRASEESEVTEGRGPARVDVLVMSQGDLHFGARRGKSTVHYCQLPLPH